VPQNFLSTSLPDNTGPVNVIEYSRRSASDGASNYFFAGGINGLNVFADQFGNGFAVNTLTTLDNAPFATGSWQRIPTIKGSVIDIKSSGNTLYVMTCEQTTQQPVYKILRIPYTTNISSMFLPANIYIIAQSGTAQPNSDLSGTGAWYSMQIITTNAANTIEQLALATNNGLFVSTPAGGIQAATSQAAALWTAFNPDANSKLFSGIARVQAPYTSTVWPLSMQDPTGKKIYNQSSVHQLSGNGSSPNTFGYAPIPFDPYARNLAQATYPLMRYFWSDGGQGIAIVNTPPYDCPSTTLMAIPGNLAEWNLQTAQLITAPSIGLNPPLYWIGRIGATGRLLAGTNKGVVALE
jgi:hypothetical protein